MKKILSDKDKDPKKKITIAVNGSVTMTYCADGNINCQVSGTVAIQFYTCGQEDNKK